jgi:hypothetical protein
LIRTVSRSSRGTAAPASFAGDTDSGGGATGLCSAVFSFRRFSSISWRCASTSSIAALRRSW